MFSCFVAAIAEGGEYCGYSDFHLGTRRQPHKHKMAQDMQQQFYAQQQQVMSVMYKT